MSLKIAPNNSIKALLSIFLLILSSTRLKQTAAQATQTPNPEQPNEVVLIDLQTKLNTARHHTFRYGDLGVYNRNLVLRRGEMVDFIIQLARPYNKNTDKFRLEFALGMNAQLTDKSLVYVPLLHADDNNNSPNRSSFPENPFAWEARTTTSDNDTTTTTINTPPGLISIMKYQLRAQFYVPANAPVGGWRLRISTKIAGTRNMQTFAVRDPLIYIIFNPWSPSDDVYLAREDARTEYVLNEVGKIYIGSYAQSVGRKWVYGQFEPPVLPSVMHMLDRYKLSADDRSNVVKVARMVSAIVNANDDQGFLVGNWSGSYGDGLAPWQWTGSAPVFRKFVQNGYRPVKFGQCWVFGGVTTTTLRTLGIPARTISNFVSAHDTDSSLTVDKFHSSFGSEITGVNGDSIWNFHVWSDAWMARPDLPPGFGGWQAVDATPQEKSMGVFQLGPASLEAIKQGKVDYAYDVAFVYSEVNADVVNWSRDNRMVSAWRPTNVQGSHVGRKILTKIIGYIDDGRSRYGITDAENIVLQYKYPEGSAEAKQARAEAVRSAGLSRLFGQLRR